MVQMNLFEDRNRDADTETGFVDVVWGGWRGEAGTNWEIRIDMRKIDS